MSHVDQLTNEQLLGEVKELGEEMHARVKDYLARAREDDVALREGLFFAVQAYRALDPGDEGIYWLKLKFERLAESARAPDENRTWQGFLEGHPELAEAKPESEYAFTDEEVFAATPAEPTWVADILRTLAIAQGWKPGAKRKKAPTHRNRMQVVAALRRLERGDRVVQVKRQAYGQRASSLWGKSDA